MTSDRAWVEREIPAEHRLAVAKMAGRYGSPVGLELDTHLFVRGELKALVSKSNPAGWHLSISHPRRYPTWDEIVEARYSLLPDEITVGLLLPPKAEYVNVHPNCFHLWQVPSEVKA